jgi:hypothetical protein
LVKFQRYQAPQQYFINIEGQTLDETTTDPNKNERTESGISSLGDAQEIFRTGQKLNKQKPEKVGQANLLVDELPYFLFALHRKRKQKMHLLHPQDFHHRFPSALFQKTATHQLKKS